MSITININPGLEKRLREKAHRTGVEFNHLVERVLESWSETPIPVGNKSNKNREIELLQKINNTGFSADFWVKYRMLIQKRQAEIIDQEELSRLVKMSDRLEKANVQRVKYLIELAQIRDVPVRILMQQLGVPQESHE
jgi:hypothetical protein